MGVQLNIKSEEAYTLAAELAELTGESLTTVVTAALRERLDRERRSRTREARIARIRAAAAEIRAGMVDPEHATSDHSELYDEHGLPR
jgi:antitoxin VapB